MNWLLLSRMLGMLGMLVGGSMVFSLPWAFPQCGQTAAFEVSGFWGIVSSVVICLLIGGLLYFIGRKENGTILRKEALAIVGLGWMFSGALGSLPYLLSGTERAPDQKMTVVDALFESVSGFTTTGASVLTQLEDSQPAKNAAKSSTDANQDKQSVKLIPRCVLFWRSFTHWLGGMGIIVLFVAILGQLGAGGKALMRREVPGPITETVRPRVRDTAIVMWAIYVVISFIMTILLLIEGMSVFDALCHTFGTMATGGFSTHNASVGYFDSVVVESTLIVFMIVAGTNFSLFYLVIRNKDRKRGRFSLGRLASLGRDPEFRCYLTILAIGVFVLSIDLLWHNIYPGLTSLRHAAFVVVSIMTTTGFGTENFSEWSEFSKGMILLLMFIGGSAGSTGGGIKVIRFMLFAKIIRLEVEQAFRPNVVRPLRIAGVTLNNSLRHEVLVYFGLILLIFVASWILLVAIEPNNQWETNLEETVRVQDKLIDCASAVAATLNNIGPGLGVVGPHENYAHFSGQGKLLLTLLMLLGRLELFAILVLFVPSFWRIQ